nr:uncharacterized protein LOC111517691 [Leptinotarsa decemlineata]
MYSISRDYWTRAGSLVVSPSDSQLSDGGYDKCMRDENCIVGTIIEYTKSWGEMDCNCDGSFNCKDLAAIHLFGRKCERPMFGSVYASRFNHCANRIGVSDMLTQEGGDLCTVPDAQ